MNVSRCPQEASAEHGARVDRVRKGLGRALVTWFRTHRRTLPWREQCTPYAVWIAETMLQQTQVATVIPYFEGWMQRFPDVASVAAARQEQVLKSWEGLGYYARARNLHRAARIMVERFQGRVPQQHEELLRLPGIGPYTAGAIMSIAFNEEYPLVDANVERVFARLFDLTSPVKERVTKRFIWDAARALIPKGKAGAFNQALMELGAMVCLPGAPRCQACPAKNWCTALEKGVVEHRPVAGKKKRATPLEVALGVLVHRGRILIQKRPDTGLMANLWEFPGGKLEPGETPAQAVRREFREELEIDVRCDGKITVIRHSYTSFRVTLHCHWCRLEGEGQTPKAHAAQEVRWVAPAELEALPFPAADRRLIRLLQSKGEV